MTAPIRLYMSMSLDGFIARPDDREGQELGRDGGRLFNWLDDRMSPVPVRRRRCCGQGYSTRWRSISCRSCSAEGDACSTRLAPATSNLNWFGDWRAPA
jgi:hypothetical protein